MGYAMDQFHTLDLALFLAGAFAAAFVTGLAGFAFAIVAAAVWLHFMAPAQATPLINRVRPHRAGRLGMEAAPRDPMETPHAVSGRRRHRRADRR